MFAWELVGTANAMVAGWGNFGGEEKTKFSLDPFRSPHLQLPIKNYENPKELAWQTSFVVPTVIAFMAAYVYRYHCGSTNAGYQLHCLQVEKDNVLK